MCLTTLTETQQIGHAGWTVTIRRKDPEQMLLMETVSGNSPSFATLLYLTCDFLFLLKFLDANDANDAAFAAQIRKETI